MKRWILCLWLCLMLAAGASAASLDALYIDCDVQADGSASFSLAVSARFDALEKSFTIPLTGEKVSGVSVSGGSWDLETSDGWPRVILHNGDGFIGRQTFVVAYKASAPSKDDPANDNLSLQLIGSRWEVDAAEVTFDVQMPTPLETPPVMMSGYSGELMGIATLTATGFSGMTEGGLMAHESLTADLTLPQGYFDQAQLRNLLAMDWGAVLLALLAVLCVVYWMRSLRNRRPVVQSRVLPPEGWTPVEVPMILDGSRPNPAALLPLWGQLGYLYVDFAGGELILGQRMAMGSERPAYEIELFRQLFEGRREFWMPDRRFRQAEALIARTAARLWRARLFDRHSGNPKLMQLLAALTAGIAVAVSAASLLPVGAGWTLLAVLSFVPGMALGLFGQKAVGELRRRPWPHIAPLPGLVALLALTLLGLGRPFYTFFALALQIFVGWQLAYGGRRSAAGTEALGQLLSLRQFLLHASQRRLQEVLHRDPAWLQTILPYAAQLGLAERLAQRIGPLHTEEPAWLRTDEPLTEPVALVRQMTALLAQLQGEKKHPRLDAFRQLIKRGK